MGRLLPSPRLTVLLLAGAFAASAVAGCSSKGSDASSSGDGDAGPGAEGGEGAGDGGTADELPACEGVDLSKDGTYDVDVKAVAIRGKVTVDGAPKPLATGSVTLVPTTPAGKRKGGGATTQVLEDGSYETTVVPGAYDVLYTPDASACASAQPPSAWPCSAGVVKKNVTVASNGVIDLDLATALVTGKALVRGKVAAERIALTFTGTEGGASGTAVGARVVLDGLRADYAIRLLKGTYDVGYAPPSGTCTATVPCNAGIVRPNVPVTASGVVDVDVPMSVVRGAVSLDGVRMTPTTRGGSLVFALAGAKATAGASVQIATDGSYAVAVLPGTYVVTFAGVPSTSVPSLPRSSGLVKPSVALQTDGTLDVDVPTASVSGRVTVNGAVGALSPGASRGSVTFTSPTGGAVSTPVGEDGRYATVLVAGSYDAGYAPGSSTCAPGGASTWPCNAGVVKPGVSLTKGSGALDLDLKVVSVNGKVTVDGRPLPVIGRTAVLTFAAARTAKPAPADDADELPGAKISSASVTIAEGDTYAARLLAGTYDVGWGGTPCSSSPEDPLLLPCNAGVVKPNAALAQGGALDVDVRTARISGRVTLGGKPAPDADADRGALSFATAPLGTGGSAATARFGEAGPISYTTRLLRGRYVVRYEGASCRASAEAMIGSPFPCGGAVLAGCE